jgi:hypothetical protein
MGPVGPGFRDRPGPGPAIDGDRSPVRDLLRRGTGRRWRRRIGPGRTAWSGRRAGRTGWPGSRSRPRRSGAQRDQTEQAHDPGRRQRPAPRRAWLALQPRAGRGGGQPPNRGQQRARREPGDDQAHQRDRQQAPNRRHSAPAISMVATAPADMPSSASPRAADEAPVCSLTAGTRTAQLAKMNPCAANTAHNATLAARRRAEASGRGRVVDPRRWILFTSDTK